MVGVTSGARPVIMILTAMAMIDITTMTPLIIMP